MKDVLEITVTKDDIKNGVKQNCGKCPIALAMQRVLGEDVEVNVKYTMAHIYRKHKTDEDKDYMCSHLYSYILPMDARNFISEFDQGHPVSPINLTLLKKREV